MKNLLVMLVLVVSCPVSAGEREWHDGMSKFQEMLTVCDPSKKTPEYLYETRECWANFLPQRCKSLAWIEEEFSLPIQMCLSSCVGKNTAFGDCSK